MSTLVKKIAFRGYEGLNRLYLGNDLIFYTEPEPVEWKGLTFTALEPSTVQYTPEYGYTSNPDAYYGFITYAMYSFDGIKWKCANEVTLNLNTGEKVFFQGYIWDETSSRHPTFTMTGKIAASGSIMSMVNLNPEDTELKYTREFYGLFENCTSLVTAPEFPATTLSMYCYEKTFRGCTSLTTAPELPSTSLADACYMELFRGCTSLTTAPELPALYLPIFSYNFMFYGCSSLNFIKAMFLTNPTTNNVNNWVNGVSSTGTFVKNKDATWTTTGVNGIPTGWTVETA